MSLRCPSALLPNLLLALLAPLLAGRAPARESAGHDSVDPALGPRIAEAVAEAGARLGTMPCALVLADFVDSRTGLTLAENLAATGRTAQEHVASLLFRGAPNLKPFPGRRVFAYTTPASPVVLLCREDLLRVQNQRRFVTAVVLHEVLHTLGLREDLPSSLAITERVLERCF